MKKSILNRLRDVFSEQTGKNMFGKLDKGILKTLMMLAAVDGEIADVEISSFKELARKLRGYNGESFDAVWETALHGAGYILLQARFSDVDGLVAAFVKEAEADFVDEVSHGTSEERERAFNCLESMASADGDYSEIERRCIEALAQRVKEVRDQVIAERYPRAVVFDK